MIVYEYIAHPRSDIVHLILQAAHTNPYASIRTLCGREVLEDWLWGDETVSGRAATCGSCRLDLERREVKNDSGRVDRGVEGS